MRIPTTSVAISSLRKKLVIDAHNSLDALIASLPHEVTRDQPAWRGGAVIIEGYTKKGRRLLKVIADIARLDMKANNAD